VTRGDCSDGLNRSRFFADNEAAVTSRLPLFLIPLPALVLGALVAAGLI
jgi:hypothetical protein